MEERYCALTKELDKYCKYDYDYLKSYICIVYPGAAKLNENGKFCLNTVKHGFINDTYESEYSSLAIRFPGATCGSVKINTNFIIEEVHFYDSVKYNYNKTLDELNEIFKKFIGTKIWEE